MPLQVNGNLQAQVSSLQGDNFSFQKRVTALQETTSSLSVQISALAQQAQAAASVNNQVQVSCLCLVQLVFLGNATEVLGCDRHCMHCPHSGLVKLKRSEQPMPFA